MATAADAPNDVQERLFAAASVAARQLVRERKRSSTEIANWPVAATTVLLTEFKKAPTASVFNLLHQTSLQAPTLTAEDVAVHVEALMSAEVVRKFAAASAVHAWALCAVAAELAVWVWRLSSATGAAVDVASLALRLSIMQAQADVHTDMDDVREDFVPTAETPREEAGSATNTQLGDNFVVLLTRCLLSAALADDSAKVAAFAGALAVCIGNRPSTKKMYFENDGIKALHLALETVMNVQESHPRYYVGLCACFDLLRRAFYGSDPSYVAEYVKKYTPHRLRSTLLSFLKDQAATAPKGFAAATASTCAVLATSSEWCAFLFDRSKSPRFQAASLLVESAAHLFAWAFLAFHETTNLDDLDAGRAVSLAVKLIENRCAGREPRDPKLVSAAVLVLRKAVDRGVQIEQSDRLLELFKTKILKPDFARGYFQDRIYNRVLKLVQAISPPDASGFVSRNEEIDVQTGETSQQSTSMQEQLIKRMLPAVQLVAPFLTTAFAAYEYGKHDALFLQVYCEPHLGERAGQVLPPIVIDAVCQVSFAIRIAQVCDNPSLRAVGKSLPDLFSLPEPAGDNDEVTLAHSVVDRHFDSIVGKHRNVTGMQVSTVRQRGAASGTPTTDPEVVVAIYVFEKGIIPYGSSPLPKTLATVGNENSFAVDVREGHFELLLGQEAMVRNVDEAYAGCSVSTRPDKGAFSIAVYAQLEGVPGFITCSHGIKEPGEMFTTSREVVAASFDDVRFFSTKTSTVIGAAKPEHVHYESAEPQHFPDGIDTAFVTTSKDMLRLSFVDLHRSQWANVLPDRIDEEEAFALRNAADIPADPVRIVGPSTFPLAAAGPSPAIEPTVQVIKAGRSTGLTRGGLRAVRQLNVVHGALVSEANVPPVIFKRMLVVVNDPRFTDFSRPGDSGSPILQLERVDDPPIFQARFVGVLLGSFNRDTIVLPHSRIASAFLPSRLVFGSSTAVLPPAQVADDATRETVRAVAERLEVNEADMRPELVTLDEALAAATSTKERAHLRRHYGTFFGN